MKADVCIVGGGPAGMLLGLLLARRGVQACVLEGHETFDREFRDTLSARAGEVRVLVLMSPT